MGFVTKKGRRNQAIVGGEMYCIKCRSKMILQPDEPGSINYHYVCSKYNCNNRYYIPTPEKVVDVKVIKKAKPVWARCATPLCHEIIDIVTGKKFCEKCKKERAKFANKEWVKNNPDKVAAYKKSKKSGPRSQAEINKIANSM